MKPNTSRNKTKNHGPKIKRLANDGYLIPESQKRRLQSIHRDLEFSLSETRHVDDALKNYLHMLVDPAEAEPVPQPSVMPLRCGVAKYSLGVSVTGMSDFGVVVMPTIEDPLRISSTRTLGENTYGFSSVWEYSHGFQDDVNYDTEGVTMCSEQVLIPGPNGVEYYSCPASSTAGCTLQADYALLSPNAEVPISLLAYDGASWVTLDSTVLKSGQPTRSTPGIVWSPVYTHYTLVCTSSDSATVGLTLFTTAGIWTCISAPSEFVLDGYSPPWSKLIGAAESVRVVAESCLVTYHGATLNDQGNIAMCSAYPDFAVSGSFYESIMKRPYDKADNRLGPKGDSPGGGYWWMCPTSVHQMFPDPASKDLPDDIQCGYFGIAGADPAATIRVRLDIVVEYQTLDPSFPSQLSPQFGALPFCLHLLRQQVPLVSSNDRHLDKIVRVTKKAVSRAAAAGRKAYDNRDAIAQIAAILGPLIASM